MMGLSDGERYQKCVSIIDYCISCHASKSTTTYTSTPCLTSFGLLFCAGIAIVYTGYLVLSPLRSISTINRCCFVLFRQANRVRLIWTQRIAGEISTFLTQQNYCQAKTYRFGACCDTQKPTFPIAWMMQSLCHQIFPWNDDDLLTASGEEFHLHHDLRADGQDYETVFKWFKKWQFAKTVGAAERLRCMLVLIGKHRFFYVHQQERLLAMAAEWNGREGQKKHDIINLNWLADTLAQHVEKRSCSSSDNERYCNFTGKTSR